MCVCVFITAVPITKLFAIAKGLFTVPFAFQYLPVAGAKYTYHNVCVYYCSTYYYYMVGGSILLFASYVTLFLGLGFRTALMRHPIVTRSGRSNFGSTFEGPGGRQR